MLRGMARRLTGQLVERMVRAAQATGEPPQPAGRPRVYAMGPDPYRILVIGANAVRGTGVASHELGLGGHLARQLSALTGRGADIELIGVPGLSAPEAGRLLAEMDLGRFEALVVILGGREAIALRPAETWAREIRTLLEQIGSDARALSVFVVGIAQLSTAVPLHGMLAPVVGRQVSRLNAATREACAATGMSFLPLDLPRGRGLGDTGGTATYAAWAAPIAKGMHAVLEASRPVQRDEVADEELRQASLDALDIIDRPPTAALDAVVRSAKDLFGVAGASVNLIDRGRLHTVAAAGIERTDVPRSESFCAITVSLGGPLIIPDTRLDDRVRSLPAVKHGFLFYAGYPIEAPDRQRIGTLCIVDGAPRAFTSSDESLLRQLALRAQAELWSPSSRA